MYFKIHLDENDLERDEDISYTSTSYDFFGMWNIPRIFRK